MIKTTNKYESYRLIESLGLNKLPEIYLPVYNKSKILEFFKLYPAETYAIRDRKQSGSKFFNLTATKDDILNGCKNKEMFTINVNTMSLDATQLLTGEIKITSDGGVNFSISKNPNFSARDGALMPDYRFAGDLSSPKLKSILGLNRVVDYIFAHELFDAIVEFASFDKRVGTKNEYVVVFELRTDY